MHLNSGAAVGAEEVERACYVLQKALANIINVRAVRLSLRYA